MPTIEFLEIEFSKHCKERKNKFRDNYGFKLHPIIDEQGKILAFQLTLGYISDVPPVKTPSKDIIEIPCNRLQKYI